MVRLDYTIPLVGRNLTGAVRSPAAPYLGAAELATAPQSAAGRLALADPVATPATQPATADSTAPLPAATPAALAAQPLSSPVYFHEEEDTQAPDLEADLLPLTPANNPPVLATFSGSAGPGGPALLPGEAEARAAEATSTTVAAPADAPATSTQSAAASADTEPVAAPAPRAADMPVVASEVTAEADAPAEAASLTSSATVRLPLEATAALAEYPAPDLNLQVIRYARFGVPAALAEQPFEVIYAPAWPTWLAAVELRQRTGRPLVLHLRALAADHQSADTAAGWPAEIQRQALRQADLVLAETYALARRLRRELGLANGTVRVVPAADGAAVARALRRAQRR